MNRYSFVEVHLKQSRSIVCELCDHTWKEVDKYYAYEIMHVHVDGAYPIEHRALDCCLHLGDIVDWREDGHL
jgi:hypothetical protein